MDNPWFVEEIIHPELLDYFAEKREDLLKGKVTPTYEYRIIDSDGHEKWIVQSNSGVFDAEGNILAIEGICRDVTERKQAEQTLSQNQEALRKAQRLARLGFLTRDLKSNEIYWSDEVFNLFGLDPQSTTPTVDLGARHIHPDDSESVQQSLSCAINGIAEHNMDHRILRSDGEVIWVHAQAELTRDVEGKPDRLLGTIIDITDRKKVEELLRESQKRYSLAAKVANIGNWEYDPNSDTIYWSEQIPSIFGFKRGEFSGTQEALLGRVHPEDRQDFMDLSTDLTAGKKKSFSIEYRIIWPDGTIHWVLSKGGVIREDQGSSVRFAGMVQDITERKRAEEELGESEEKHRKLTENLPQRIFHKDTNLAYLSCNKHYAQDLEICTDEIVGKTDFDFYPRELAEKYRADDRRVMESGQSMDIEELYIKDGQELFVQTVKTPLTDGVGNVTGILGIFWDITERRQAEKALELSLSFLRRANVQTTKATLLAGFVKDIQHFTECEAVGLRLLGSAGQIPYESYAGFPKEFYGRESALSTERDRCLCTSVVTGQTDSALPFYTEDGSFYMNSTTDFLATLSEEDKGKNRSVCNEFGYESVALVPIRSEDSILGLVHIADSQKGKVPIRLVKSVENLTLQMSTAIRRVSAEEKLNKHTRKVEQEIKTRTKQLVKANALLNRQIKECKVLEKELESLARFPAENPNPVLRVRKDGEILYANEAGELLLDKWKTKVGETVTNRWRDLISEAFLSEEGAAAAAAEEEVQGRVFSCVISPVRNAGYVNLYARDVTKRKQAEDEARRRREELLHASRLSTVGEMALSLAHELNQPLCAILTHGNVCLRTSEDEIEDMDEFRENLKVITSQSKRAGGILNRIKTFVQRDTPQYTRVNINEIVHEAVRFVAQIIKDKAIILDLQLHAQLPAILADPIHIEQVLMNLANNAIESMQTVNAQKHRLTIQTSLRSHGFVELAVSDTGKGLPESTDKVFESFFTTKEHGLGMGLSICRSIVEAHRGTLWAEPCPDRGCTFKLALPVGNVMDKATVHEKES